MKNKVTTITATVKTMILTAVLLASVLMGQKAFAAPTAPAPTAEPSYPTMYVKTSPVYVHADTGKDFDTVYRNTCDIIADIKRTETGYIYTSDYRDVDKKYEKALVKGDYKIVKTLKRNQKVSLVTKGKTWSKIQYADDKTGYVRTRYLSSKKMSSFRFVRKKTALYAKPSAKAKKIKKLSINKRLTVIKKTNSKWYEVKTGKYTGYVKKACIAKKSKPYINKKETKRMKYGQKVKWIGCSDGTYIQTILQYDTSKVVNGKFPHYYMYRIKVLPYVYKYDIDYAKRRTSEERKCYRQLYANHRYIDNKYKPWGADDGTDKTLYGYLAF